MCIITWVLRYVALFSSSDHQTAEEKQKVIKNGVTGEQNNPSDVHLFEFVQVIWLLVEVEFQQLSLQIFNKGFTPDEALDGAVRERIAVEL